MASLIRYRCKLDLLTPARGWLDNLKVRNFQLACWLCRLIPASSLSGKQTLFT